MLKIFDRTDSFCQSLSWKRISTHSIRLLMTILLPLGSTDAQMSLGEFNFENGFDASNVAPGFEFTNIADFSSGVDVFLSASSRCLFVTGWPDNEGSEAISADDYFGFTITNNSNSPVLLTSMNYQLRRTTGRAPSLLQIRGSQSNDFSLEGAAILSNDSDVEGIDVPINDEFEEPLSLEISGFVLQPDASIQFRFYGYSGDNGFNRELLFDNISVMSVLLGDVNCDGAVDLLDIAPFIEALQTGPFEPKADMNQDGQVNLLDVGPFVDLLAG